LTVRAINQNTNKVYVTGHLSNSVYGINGYTNKLIKTIPVGLNPDSIAVNPNTNMIYVANSAANTISVIAIALTLGTSLTYVRRIRIYRPSMQGIFPFLQVAKGNNNFVCAVKVDFIKNGTYRCGSCNSNNANECYHKTVDYGPCMNNEDFEGRGCRYRIKKAIRVQLRKKYS
jgi:YVTN family beta-propeller protein